MTPVSTSVVEENVLFQFFTVVDVVNEVVEGCRFANFCTVNFGNFLAEVLRVAAEDAKCTLTHLVLPQRTGPNAIIGGLSQRLRKFAS